MPKWCTHKPYRHLITPNRCKGLLELRLRGSIVEAASLIKAASSLVDSLQVVFPFNSLRN